MAIEILNYKKTVRKCVVGCASRASEKYFLEKEEVKLKVIGKVIQFINQRSMQYGPLIW